MKRVKRRYLALQLECEDVPNGRELMDSIWAAVTKLYGEIGASLAGLNLVSLDVERKVAIVRVSLAALNLLRASLATINSIAGKVAVVQVLSISGSLKALHANIQ
jgi:RNase P/RNase MRP subunit POP5